MGVGRIFSREVNHGEILFHPHKINRKISNFKIQLGQGPLHLLPTPMISTKYENLFSNMHMLVKGTSCYKAFDAISLYYWDSK